ncbi:hypothetical protein [Streptomyces scopuliridis]|uniref:Alkylmercury lyase n=1 Tax=Streptomyces scopuliridis RB72 TaxID=1440053 RepID=A0A2T7T641_9ACTN|nr:hypothetical protein [Streptomyces scopuliridis]PVE10643.1 hypothetical protein Y717_26995 [Streptomyces scopuliridis RB72]
MDIQLLVVPDCPNAAPTAERLRGVLDGLGMHNIPVTQRTVADQMEAERIGFTGSPTVLIDGRDPFAEPGRPAGPACRVFRTEDGVVGVPGTEQLRRAIVAAL